MRFTYSVAPVHRSKQLEITLLFTPERVHRPGNHPTVHAFLYHGRWECRTAAHFTLINVAFPLLLRDSLPRPGSPCGRGSRFMCPSPACRVETHYVPGEALAVFLTGETSTFTLYSDGPTPTTSTEIQRDIHAALRELGEKIVAESDRLEREALPLMTGEVVTGDPTNRPRRIIR